MNPRNDKSYRTVNSDNKLSVIIQGIITAVIPVAIRPHFLIGLSLVVRLIIDKQHITDNHRYLMTSAARIFE